MTAPSGTESFERDFPAAFADTVKDLVDDLALDALLVRLGASVSAQVAPATVRIERADPDAVSETPAGDAADRRRYVVAVDQAWDVSLRGPAGAVTEAQLDAVAGFVAWIVDRHAGRRRRLTAVDHERQLIAAQLHDDPIQAMTAVSLHLQRLARTSAVDPEQIDRLLNLTNGAIDRLRHVMFALHPPSLAADGLAATIEDYLDAFIAPTGLRVAVTGDIAGRVKPEIEALAFRLARGAIHNSWEHARARSIEVALACDGGVLHITVRDDGVGFDVDRGSHPDIGHAGLEYAADLAAEVGGRYVVTSAPGAGTTVRIDLPSS